MILCRLLDCWLISNNLQDSVSVTNILSAIKTDHAAISLDFNISQNHIKGPGCWRMNCFLLDDDNYQREATAKMPVWLAQGRGCDLPDHRCIWDWIKHRLERQQHSRDSRASETRARVKITPCGKRRHAAGRPFPAWGGFYARSRLARSTISEEKWGTTRSLD